MADDIKGSITYDLNIEGYATDDLKKMSEEADKTNNKLEENKEKQKQAQLDSITTLSSLQSINSGLNSIASGFNTLEIGSESFRNSITKAAAAINLFIGAAQTLKGVSALLNMLNVSLGKTAIMSAFAWAAANPLIAILAVGAAGVAGGYMVSQVTNVNNSSSTTFNASTSTTRKADVVISTGSYY